MGKELIDRHGRTVRTGQIFGDVEADTACPDNRHAFANRLRVGQGFDVGDDIGPIRTIDIECARRHAGCNDDVIEPGVTKLFGRGPGVQADIDTGSRQARSEIADGFVEIFFARNAFGEIELSTKGGGRFKQRYVMSAFGGGQGR